MIALIAVALAFDPAAELGMDVMPPPDPFVLDGMRADVHGVADLEHVVIVRLHEMPSQGLDSPTLALVTEAVLEGRETSYDIVMNFHSAAMPRNINAGAFHSALNSDDQWGTGVRTTTHPRVDTRSLMWMNHPFYWEVWDSLGDDIGDWVFCHEMAHRWLARAQFDDDGEVSDAMLGRQTYHWSYFLNTPNSPIEGNAWIDRGDGSFEADTTVPWRFSTLDLYLMGMADRSEVEPTFLITDVTTPYVVAATAPVHLRDSDTEPVVVEGTRRDITIDEIIDAMGPRYPEAALAPRDFSVLTVFVVGPREIVPEADLVRVAALQASWEAAWFAATDERSTVSFSFDDPTHVVPPMPVEASLVPEVAR